MAKTVVDVIVKTVVDVIVIEEMIFCIVIEEVFDTVTIASYVVVVAALAARGASVLPRVDAG